MLPASLLYLSVEGSMERHYQLLLPLLSASLERLRLSDCPRPLHA